MCGVSKPCLNSMIKVIRSFIVTRLWPHRISFARYTVVGTSSFAFDIVLIIFFSDVLRWKPMLAVLLVQPIIIVYNFLLNKYWSFSSSLWSHKQVVKYLSLVVWNYAFSFLSMMVFNELLQIHYILVRVGTVMLMVSWNFALYKWWVYRPTL